jgi:hypothetical protein
MGFDCIASSIGRWSVFYCSMGREWSEDKEVRETLLKLERRYEEQKRLRDELYETVLDSEFCK